MDGVEGAVTNGATGFFASGAPAVLGENLIVTYGIAPPPPPADETPPGVDQAIKLIIDSTNQPTTLTGEDKNTDVIADGTSDPGGDTDKKELPVCN